ncbi:enoyl-CoA hydratase [bacterium]|nr:enoyl-CoA hydratase [bacterium]
MNDPTYETIRLERSKGVAVVTLHRPDKMNAFNSQMMLDLMNAFDVTDRDGDVGAVIVTGSGERAFCAGADLSAGASTFDATARQGRGDPGKQDEIGRQRDGGGRLTLRIFDSLKPVIAACNGAAVGVGVTMQLPMDIRLASSTARYGFVFNRRGINPEAASSWFLPRLVGIQQALDWCYTGRVFGAEEAKTGGLVHAIHEPQDLLPAAHRLAREIIDNTAPVSTTLTRQMMWRMMGADHPMEAHKIDSRAINSRGKSKDAAEGVTSFLEKRPAAFPEKVPADLPDFFPWWSERTFS